MLELMLDDLNLYDESKNEFVDIPGGMVRFEHSLKAIFMWEGFYKKPFLDQPSFTSEEMLYYYNCMIVEKYNTDITRIHPEHITTELGALLEKYIEDPHSATIVNTKKSNGPEPGRSSIVTAEVIYGMMTVLNVPMECQAWHINNLLMLLKVIAIQTGSKTPMSKNDIYKENTNLNQARRRQLNSRG